jgi:hypothetical protein
VVSCGCNENGPAVLGTPGTRPTERTLTVDTTRVPQPHHDDHDQDDAVEAHYASLERDASCYCYGSGVVVLQLEEDGQGHDFVVPCRRCKPRLDSR